MTRTLLYDGTCGLCAKSVQFILQRERNDFSLRFAPLQGPTAEAVRQAHPEVSNVDSVILVEDRQDGTQQVWIHSDAALHLLRYLGGVWKVLANVASIVPRFLRDATYKLVARTRYRVFGRDTSCLLPTPEQRARFLP